MNTHTELLNKLIQAIYDTPPCYETYRLAVLAAEIKGEMQAICEHCDTQSFTQSDCITTSPDSDGWVENTGVMPECKVKTVKLRCGEIRTITSNKEIDWHFAEKNNPMDHHAAYDVTYYKPA